MTPYIGARNIACTVKTFFILFQVPCIIAFLPVDAIASNLTIKTTAESKTQQEANTFSQSRPASFHGVIGEKYRVSGELIISYNVTRRWNQLSGTYSYEGRTNKIGLDGGLDSSGAFLINEYGERRNSSGVLTGTWFGHFDSHGQAQGTWTSPDGKKVLPFKVSVDQEPDSNKTRSESGVSFIKLLEGVSWGDLKNVKYQETLFGRGSRDSFWTSDKRRYDLKFDENVSYIGSWDNSTVRIYFDRLKGKTPNFDVLQVKYWRYEPQEDDPARWEEYRDGLSRFTIRYPKWWAAKPGKERVNVTYRGYPDPVSFIMESKDAKFTRWWQTKPGTDDFKILSKKTLTIAGRKADWVVFIGAGRQQIDGELIYIKSPKSPDGDFLITNSDASNVMVLGDHELFMKMASTLQVLK